MRFGSTVARMAVTVLAATGLASCGEAPNNSTIKFEPDTITWSVAAGTVVSTSSTSRLTVLTPTGQPNSGVKVTIVPPSGSAANVQVCAGFVDPLTCTPVATPGVPWTTETDSSGGVNLTMIYLVAGVDASDLTLVEAYSGAAYGIHRYSQECVDNPPTTCP